MNPFKGSLREMIKSTKRSKTLKTVEEFLLIVAKHVPDKIPAVIALVKYVVERGAKCNLFLYDLLKAVGRCVYFQ